MITIFQFFFEVIEWVECLSKTIERVGLKDIVHIVTDNATNYVVVV